MLMHVVRGIGGFVEEGRDVVAHRDMLVLFLVRFDAVGVVGIREVLDDELRLTGRTCCTGDRRDRLSIVVDHYARRMLSVVDVYYVFRLT